MKTFANPTKQQSAAPAAKAGRTPEAGWPTRPAEIRHPLLGPRRQAKLTVGPPNDAFEREADRVAAYSAAKDAIKNRCDAGEPIDSWESISVADFLATEE